ncbi:DUF6801 domain-containing protein [Streptomyces sp. NPDC001758]
MRAQRAVIPRPRRARAKLTSMAAFVVLAALIPTTASAAGTQEVDAELPYVCALPSGKAPATVRISADFPQRVKADEAFSPTGVTTTVELPAQAVADLTARDAAEVRPVTRLAVGVAQNSATAAATWRGSSEPVALPESGPLTLTTRGDVPSVSGRSDGDLTFTAGALAIDLDLGTADGTETGTGTGTESDSDSDSDSPSASSTGSASLTVDCAPAEDAPDKRLLATVPVGPDSPGTGGSPSAPAPDGTSSAPESGQRDRQGDRSPRVLENSPGTAADRDVPPCRYDEQHPPMPRSLNAYVTGYANVKKQKGASYLPPSCVLIMDGGEFRWASRVLQLVDDGAVPDAPLIRCEDHLTTLWLLSDSALVDRVAARELAPLDKLTARRRDRLVETLRVHVSTRAPGEQVGEMLGVHAQTVRYRLRTLDTYLGDRLADPDHRFALEVALRALHLRSHHGTE